MNALKIVLCLFINYYCLVIWLILNYKFVGKNKTIQHELKMSPQISVFFFSYQTKTDFLFQQKQFFFRNRVISQN